MASKPDKSLELMLPKSDGQVVIATGNNNRTSKLLIREDTVLAGLQRCSGCGRAAALYCTGAPPSQLCWGKNADGKQRCLLITFLSVFLTCMTGVIVFCFTNTINKAVLSNMILRNGSLAYDMWLKPSVHPLMKIHLFNYTNIERVRAGLDARLHVDELGPYVYQETLSRVNVEFTNDSERVTYQERTSFTFLPELSNGTQYDTLYVPNLPLLGIMGIASNMNLGFLESALNIALASNEPFLKLPAHRFLWGYEEFLINAVKPLLKLQGKMPYEKFGLLASKNGTLKDRITINTGISDINKLNRIVMLNNASSLGTWSTDECNSLDSTDGSLFPQSMLDRRQTLMVLNSNLCRRLPFVYERDVETLDGILALRYRPPLNVFDSSLPENQCYCHIDSGTCPPSGVVNVTACAYGAPAFASFPHFYTGSDELLRDIDGLMPDARLHASYVDIHPVLGVPLNVKSRIQINVQVKKLSGFTNMKFLKSDVILPVAWIEMTIGSLPPHVRRLLYHGTFSTAAVQVVLTWGSVLGAFISLIVLIHLCTRRPNKGVTITHG